MTSGVTAPNTRPTSIRTHSRPATSKNIVAQDATPQATVEVKDKPVTSTAVVATTAGLRSPVKSRSVSPQRLNLGSPTKSLASSHALGKIITSEAPFYIFEKKDF